MASYATRKRGAREATAAAKRYSTEAAAVLAEQRAALAATRAALSAAARQPRPVDTSSLRPGSWVRDRYGWHRVKRVNAESVTVPHALLASETERIPFGRILEVRP